MPPLPSNPEIIHAKPNSEEFTHCVQQLQTGEAWVTVVDNGDLPPKYFFTPAEADPRSLGLAGRIVTAAMVDGIVHFPPYIRTRTFRTYQEYMAVERDIDGPSRIIEGEVEAVETTIITQPQKGRGGLGRFLGLGKPRED